MRGLAGQMLVLCALAALPAFAMSYIAPLQQTNTKDGAIESSLSSGLAGEQTLWIDARSEKEFQRGAVPGALLLTVENWEALIEPVLERWRPGMRVIVYCDPGCGASQKVAERLRAMGIEPVEALEGGFPAWMAARR